MIKLRVAIGRVGWLRGALAGLGVALLILGTGPVAVAGTGGAPKISNPVSRSFADTFADPSIIHAKDGWWYAYSTADPLRAGDANAGIMHIARTRDFVSWDYQGTVFNDTNRPSWATGTSGLWAPDIRYVNGRYVLYFTVTDTTLNDAPDDSAIGVATSASPVGPWTPTDQPVVAPRPGNNGGFFWTYDPAGFTDIHGNRYLYYGSYYGGLWVSRMSDDGLTARGLPTQVAINDRYEGSYVVRHGDWYYLMGSSANCCAGPATGYSVFAGRSRSPLGPFRDADGIALTASRVGGTVVVTQNGNRWIGAGHHAIATDNAGRDFIVYHAIDRHLPWLNEPFGINRRPMLLDRIDWVGGWPRVRAGAGPSDTPQPAPVTGSHLGINAEDPAAAGFRGLRSASDPQSGLAGRVSGTARTRAVLTSSSVRVRLDVRTRSALRVRLGDASGKVTVVLNSRRRLLTLTSRTHGGSRSIRTRLAGSGQHWRTLVIEIDRGRLSAQVSESDLGDPLAEVRQLRRGFELKPARVRLRSAGALVDNVSIRPLARDARRTVPVPQAGRLLGSDEFDGPLSADWSWVRKDPHATVAAGSLSWPVQQADLVGGGNNASVLLRDAPSGDWIAQTKLTLDLGETTVRNFQQAGLIAYDSDDNFARLCSVAIWNTRQTEFGREVVVTPDGRTIYGGAVVGTPAPTVWLRLAHTRNGVGEHLYRAASSRDAHHWTWGAVWTFAADTNPRIGLVAHGGANPPITARFDYLRFYATGWPGGLG